LAVSASSLTFADKERSGLIAAINTAVWLSQEDCLRQMPEVQIGRKNVAFVMGTPLPANAPGSSVEWKGTNLMGYISHLESWEMGCGGRGSEVGRGRYSILKF
jgi:hypothetical protein